MDKTIHSSKLLKEAIVAEVSKRMQLPETVVDAVVMHQFRGIMEALQKCTSVEMSGFGTFYFQDNRAKRLSEHMKKELEHRRQTGECKSYNTPSEKLEDEIARLKTFIDNAGKNKKHSRRLEEHDSEK